MTEKDILTITICGTNVISAKKDSDENRVATSLSQQKKKIEITKSRQLGEHVLIAICILTIRIVPFSRI